MIRVVAATPELIAQIELQPAQVSDDNRDLWIGSPQAAQLLPRWGIVGVDDEKPFAAGLFLPMRPGLGAAMAWISQRCIESFAHKKVLVRSAHDLLAAAERKGYWRIEAHVDPRHGRAIPWVEHLGFEYEGRMRAWGLHREDFLLYARVAYE